MDSADRRPVECPACTQVMMVPGAGTLHEDVCGMCGLRAFDPPAAEELRTRFLKVTNEDVQVAAQKLGGGILHCRGCNARMKQVHLRGHAVDSCMACGALVLRKGQLASITGGAVPENAPVFAADSPAQVARALAWAPLALLVPAVSEALAAAWARPVAWVASAITSDAAVQVLVSRFPHAVAAGFTAPAVFVLAMLLAPPPHERITRVAPLLGAALGGLQGLRLLASWGGVSGLLAVLSVGVGAAWMFRHARAFQARADVEGLVPLDASRRLARRLAGTAGGSALVVAGACVAVALVPALQSRAARCPPGAELRVTALGGGVSEHACFRRDGVRHGPTEHRDARGTVLLSTHHAEGVPQGPHAVFHPDGARRESGQHLRGQRTGTWTEWFPDGHTRQQGNYVDGRLDGPRITFHASGLPAEEAFFRGGVQVGSTTRWDADGRPR